MKLSDKKFVDFKKTLTPEKFEAISEDAIKFTNENPVEEIDGEINLGNHIGIISNLIALSLLNEYHEWLMKDVD